MQQHVYAIAQACENAGITQAIICPGSRSAPLVFAFTQSGIKCHSVVDERSAAYMALGMAQQLNMPVVIICTSGTASLNLFPGIAESFYQKTPLLVLTADRPPELLNQQDGQMIMQKEVYGKHVLASFELPCYLHGQENNKETTAIIEQALIITNGLKKGPVHVNIPLSEPLYPQKKVVKTRTSITAKTIDNKIPFWNKKEITAAWQTSKRKLILLGQLPINASLISALTILSKHEDIVIVCDILSNQYAFNTAPQFDFLITRADAKTLEAMQPDLILSAGGPVLSKALKKWLQLQQPQHHFRINSSSTKVDTYQNVTQHLETEIAAVLNELTKLPSQENVLYKPFWEVANSIIDKGISQFLGTKKWSEIHAMNYVMQNIPDISNVHLGNSSIIRYASYLGLPNASWIMSGNRGTSGIDGCTSTAVGAALVNNRPTFLISGDIAFLYDINALWNKLPSNFKIIVFNNQGGGIFNLIDGPSKHSKQLHFFTTPHQQSIEKITIQKGIEYYCCSDFNGLQKAAQFFNPTSPSALLEIKTDIKTNSDLFRLFKRLKL